MITRQSDGSGYLISDNQCSGHGVQEADIMCCPHCQCTIQLQAWRKERELGGGGYCRKCKAPVCGPCLHRMLRFGCEPFLRLVDKAVQNQARMSNNMKVMGS